MSEQRPLFEFGGRAQQLEWIVRNSRFLAFYPAQYAANLVGGPNERQDEFEGSIYRLDGESVTVIADYQDSSWDTIVSVEIAGEPEQDAEGDWFVTQKTYSKTASDQAEALGPDMTMVQTDVYDDLDSSLLPEYYEPIKDEYEQQRRARREGLEGLEPDEASAWQDQALQRQLEDIQAQDELGLTAVGDEELGSLVEKLMYLRANPGTFVASLV